MPTISFSNLKTPESRRLLRKAVAFGMWGGTTVGLVVLALNIARYHSVPGMTARFMILGAAWVLFAGSVGYLFYSGTILGD
ncbi:MAG: hypothetical protein WC728_13970 [Elusimicrobiota bacterium]